jgi:hypothetical protein
MTDVTALPETGNEEAGGSVGVAEIKKTLNNGIHMIVIQPVTLCDNRPFDGYSIYFRPLLEIAKSPHGTECSRS